VRSIRAEMNLPPSKPLQVLAIPSSEVERGLLLDNNELVTSLGRVSELSVPSSSGDLGLPRMSATAVVGDMRIYVPLEGIVDPDAEIARLEKELAKVEKEFTAVDKKLANENFISRANPDAVEKQREKRAELTAKLSGLGDGLKKMRSLKGA